MTPSPFRRRVALGWITDLASQPDPQAAGIAPEIPRQDKAAARLRCLDNALEDLHR